MKLLADFLGMGSIDPILCENIQTWFDNQEHVEGRLGNGNVDKEIKDSRDFRLDNPDLYVPYMQELQRVLNEYIELYPRCNETAPYSISDFPNIQRYDPPTGNFNFWHAERGISQYTANRHLVFMTYLNTIQDEGATEFLHQNLEVYPEKGATLIWPADWTFTHKGAPVQENYKYIVTGWFCFDF